MVLRLYRALRSPGILVKNIIPDPKSPDIQVQLARVEAQESAFFLISQMVLVQMVP